MIRALASECAVASGSLEMCASVSYSPQEPFLFDGSVLDNILFGSKLNVKILNDVTSLCGLNRDSKSWAEGWSHIVGPGGRRCSSGQRMRISVARALYRSKVSSNGSISILDGPTTGLDEELVHSMLEAFSKYAQQGSILCISFASQQHLKILLDKYSNIVTVISLQFQSPPQILHGSLYQNSQSSILFPQFCETQDPQQVSPHFVEQHENNFENQESTSDEHREFGGKKCDV